MPAHMEIRGVSWGPPGQAVILHPTSFSLDRGRVLAIIGANGAGKSTLVRTLYRYHRPRTGTVHLDNQDIWTMDARACACRIAAVLQEQPSDFALTVREIVALGRTPYRKSFAARARHDNEIIDDALARMSLGEFANRALSTLSGGEKQRVMVARALAQEPDVIVLDEPTNYLDIRHQLEVLTLMRGLGLTIVCTLHDLNLAVAFADEILVLAEGRMLACGTAATILTDTLIAKAFGVGVRIDTLASTGARHFSFHLPT